jgi:hypothetical protein
MTHTSMNRLQSRLTVAALVAASALHVACSCPDDVPPTLSPSPALVAGIEENGGAISDCPAEGVVLGTPTQDASGKVYDSKAAFEASPKAFCSPDVSPGIDFGRVNAKAARITQIAISNEAGVRGDMLLSKDNITFTGGTPEAFTVVTVPSENIPAGSAALVEISFTPPDGREDTDIVYTSNLIIIPAFATSNAPVPENTLNIAVKGSGVRPAGVFEYDNAILDPLNAQPDDSGREWKPIENATFDLGRVGVNSPKPVPLRVENTGLGNMRIYSLGIEDDPEGVFSIQVADITALIDIAGQGSANSTDSTAEIPINCNPKEQKQYTGTLIVEHNDLNGTNADLGSVTEIAGEVFTSIKTRINLVCTGSPAGCPVPRADVIQVDQGRWSREEVTACTADADCANIGTGKCIDLFGCEAGENCGPAKYCDLGAAALAQFRVASPSLATITGLNSLDPEGVPPQQLSYSWKFGEVPSGSGAAFGGKGGEKTSTEPVVDAYIDAVGEYQLFLTVQDNQGNDCQPLEFKIVARPAQKLVAELLWPTKSADLDIHLVNLNAEDPASATIFSTPCDAYYKNRNPDWGRQRPDSSPGYCRNYEASTDTTKKDTCGDDPELSIDTTHSVRDCTSSEKSRIEQVVTQFPDLGLKNICNDDVERDCDTFLDTLLVQLRKDAGLKPDDATKDGQLLGELDLTDDYVLALCRFDTGPEQINIPEPRAGQYAVLIHYFTSAANFQAIPRVRIYLNGEKVDTTYDSNGDFLPPVQAGSTTPNPLRVDDVWNVATITWPDLPPEANNTLPAGTPVTDYVSEIRTVTKKPDFGSSTPVCELKPVP